MAPATECARIQGAFLEEERRSLGSGVVPAGYLCEFVDSGTGLFDRDLVEAALDDSVLPLVLTPMEEE